MIKAENISKSFNGIKALDDISFSVNSGEIFGIIGPDGAGKTTLFRIITTLLLPETGSVSIKGFDVVKDYKKIRTMIGYMPGRFSLYQDLSVEENLDFYASVFGTTIEDNYDLIKHIYSRIEPFKKRLVKNLSGGMKQKLALSCALIHKPELLVLDEPTTGVDAISRKELWEMLSMLKENGITILVSTPYMDEASLCDRVALIQKGGIMSVDTPENIISGYEKELLSISSSNMFRLKKDINGYNDTESVFLFGQKLHFTSISDKADKEGLRSFLQQKGHESIMIEEIVPNIEDCFMRLMNNR